MERHIGIQFSPKSLSFLMFRFNATPSQLVIIALPVFLFLVSLFQLTHEPASRDINNSLDLADAEIIRVSLYSLNRPDSLHISGSYGTVLLYSSGRADTLSHGPHSGSLILKKNQLVFSNPTLNRAIDSLAVFADSSSTRLISDSYGYRHYSGSLHFKTSRLNSGITAINAVDLETYVASVVGSEMDFENPEALKAQSVVSRTYALWAVQKSPYRDFDLLDHESSQVYFGNIQDKPRYADAAEATKGEILTWSNQLILAVFSSTCGGRTADNKDVWGGTDHPYLAIKDDTSACSVSPHFSWTYSIKVNEFNELIEQYYGFNVSSKEIVKDLSGRVQKVMLTDTRADTLIFTGNEFRLFMNRHAGPMAIRSTKYSWTVNSGTIVFEGNGLGHGVGLCQWGALGFARSGWNHKDILNFYFSGTKIVSLDIIETNTIRLYN